jgi:hypothetical protein
VYTLLENENEWQKIELVPISLPRASRNFPEELKKEHSIIGSQR